jgi:hypothetical protein
VPFFCPQRPIFAYRDRFCGIRATWACNEAARLRSVAQGRWDEGKRMIFDRKPFRFAFSFTPQAVRFAVKKKKKKKKKKKSPRNYLKP